MASEQIEAIVSVRYVGENELRRLATDMANAGAITEASAQRIINAVGMASQGALSMAAAQRVFVDALGLGASAMQQFTAQFDAFSKGTAPPQGLRDTVALLDQLESRIRRLRSSGQAIAPAMAQAMRQDFAALYTQQAGLAASPPIKTSTRPVTIGPGIQGMQTAAGTFVVTQLGGRQGYGMTLPGPTAQARAAAGEYDRTYRTKADVNAAVRDVLSAFGSVARGERPLALPPGTGAPPTTAADPGIAAAQARVLARQERLLIQEQAAQAREDQKVQRALGAVPGLTSPLALPPGPLTGGGLARQYTQYQRMFDRVRDQLNVPGPGAPIEGRVMHLGREIQRADQQRAQQAWFRYMQDQVNIPSGARAPGVVGQPPPPPVQRGPLYGSNEGPYGGGGGFRGDFMSGFRGRADRPYAEQLGQTFKFSLFYGTAYKILFTLTQTLQAALDESVGFQAGMADLNIATGRSSAANRQVAQNLGDIAASTGLSPAAGLDIGARAIGLYDLAGSGQQVQESAMRQAVRGFSQMQFTTGRTPEQLQLDVGAISQAFDYGFQAMDRIADLDAYFTKRFGIKTGATLETVAQSGSLGAQAGFSAEEVFGAAAKLQSRTGQTPAAVAGLLTQIFSRAGEGALQQQFATLGVDVSQTFREQIGELARIYPTLTEGQQQRLTASFGRGRSQGAAAALLEDWGEISGTADRARTDAGGTAAAQFEAKMQNVAGELAKLSGAFKLFAVELGNSGLLQVIGAGVLVLREFLEITTSVMRVWNELPGALRTTMLALGAFTLAAKLGGATLATSSLAGRGTYAAGPGSRIVPWRVAEAASAARGGASLSRSAGELRGPVPMMGMVNGRWVPTGGMSPAAGRAEGPMGPTFRGAVGAAGLRGTLGAGAALFGGPIGVAAIASLVTIGLARGTWEKMNAAATQATDSMINLAQVDLQSPGQLRSAAQSQREAARRRDDFWFGSFNSRAQEEQSAGFGRAAAFDVEAGYAESREKARQRAAAQDITVFGDLSQEAITQGLKQLTDSGASAATRIQLLNDALFNTSAAAAQLTASFNMDEFISKLGTGITAGIAEKVPDTGVTYTEQDVSYGRFEGGEVVDVQKRLSGEDIQKGLQGFDTTELKRRLRATAEAQGITSEAVTPEQLAAMQGSAGAYLGESLNVPEKSRDAVTALLQPYLDEIIRGFIAGAAAAVDPNRILNETEQTAHLGTYLAQNQLDLGEVRRGDQGGQISTLKTNLQNLLQLRNQGTGYNEQLELAIDNAMADYAEARLTQMQTNMRLAVRGAPNLRTAISQAAGMRQKMIASAVLGRDPQALAELITQGGEAEAELARAEIRRWYETEKAKLRNNDVVDNIRQTALAQALADTGGGDVMSESRRAQVDAQVNAAVNAYVSEGDAALKGMFDALMGGVATGLANGPSPAQVAAAQAAAQLRPGDTQGAARVAMQQAAADLREAVGTGPVEFAQAQQRFNEARAAYAASQIESAQIANSNRAARTGGDLGNARSQLQNARLELDKYAKGTQAYNQALGQLYEAQNAMAEAARQAQANRELLRLDITNPVDEANVAARQARRKLAQDRERFAPGGIDRDERAQLDVDRLDVRRAEANAEQTLFQQRLNDAQTNEQLGRISHAAYIQYLQSEHDRLSSIANRTRQQQDQLNQVDLAMKAAQEQMQGQFNLGDISLPTPYEVRRYIKATSAQELVGASAGTGPTTYIYIDGTDTGAVQAQVNQTVGASASITYTTAAKKV